VKPLDTSPRRSYRMARVKHGIPPCRAAVLVATDTWIQLRAWAWWLRWRVPDRRPDGSLYEFTNEELMEAAQRLAADGAVPTPDPDVPDHVEAVLRAEADDMRTEPERGGW